MEPGPNRRFGRYEVVRELFSSLEKTIYLARPEGSEQKPEFIVTLFRPHDFRPEAAMDHPRIGAFLNAAKLQQVPVRGREDHADLVEGDPVKAFGVDERGG